MPNGFTFLLLLSTTSRQLSTLSNGMKLVYSLDTSEKCCGYCCCYSNVAMVGGDDCLMVRFQLFCLNFYLIDDVIFLNKQPYNRQELVLNYLTANYHTKSQGETASIEKLFWFRKSANFIDEIMITNFTFPFFKFGKSILTHLTHVLVQEVRLLKGPIKKPLCLCVAGYGR